MKKKDSQILCSVKEIKDKLPVNELAESLMAIEGIDPTRANAVGEKYGKLGNLMNAYDGCVNEKAKREMLQELPLNTNNRRKMGPAASQKIYFHWHNNAKDTFEQFKGRHYVLLA